MPYGHMAKSKCQSDEDITKKKKKNSTGKN
jgi:hypothetical protein